MSRYIGPVEFCDLFISKNELGKPFALQPHQRTILDLAFERDEHGLFLYDTVVYACTKKSGKTTMSSAVTSWYAVTVDAPNECLLAANDLEQSQGRAFKTLLGLVKHNPMLAAEVADQNARVITFKNGTTVSAIASEYAGAAGSNHGFTSWDELWAYTSERSRRLWDELTPVPTREQSVRFVSTYAGFEGESDLLFELYKLGVHTDAHPDGKGIRLHSDLPCYANPEARVFIYWDHEPRMPWQTPSYYRSQRRTLRPSTYIRLHENRWTTGISTFITSELWDPCVDPSHTPALSFKNADVFVGVDAGIKNDNAAVVAVRWVGDRGLDNDDRDKDGALVPSTGQLVLVAHRLWRPSQEDPLDLEATIEAYLRELDQRFSLARIYCDPYQLHRSITTLAAARLPIQEYAQSTANTTAMGQTLFELLKGKNLRIYKDDELRAQALNTVAIESSRGWRIAKEKASRKVDAIVALAMACRGAIDVGQRDELYFTGIDADEDAFMAGR